MDDAPRLQVRGLGRTFPGVRALHDVDLTIHRGEVLAIVGENGAGKSTLVRILAGVLPPSTGEIRFEGRPIRLEGVNDALRLGIALIHQELNLADNLDVAANMFLGREPSRLGFMRQARLRRDARPFLDRVGLDVPATRRVAELPIGQRQLVEIARALTCNARVLIMDEPTSSLTTHETARLFTVVRDLRSRGVSVVYISHRLAEVREIADRVVVLRDGLNAGELTGTRITHDEMVRLMVGRELSRFYDHRPHRPGATLLEARGLRTAAHPAHPISFTLGAGEIVGLAGLVGAGRSELLETLFGITRPAGGSIRVQGRDARLRRPADAVRFGIALVPEDRRLQGLIVEMTLRENMSLASLRRLQRGGFLGRRRETSLCLETVERLDIRAAGVEQVAGTLSGGNQQKIVLGKWLALEPRILLLDEPTRGVDVGAKAEIYRLMEQLAAGGAAVLFASSDLEEILGMSDRCLVMHEGRLAGELPRDGLTEEAVMHLATGRTRAARS